MWSPSVVRTIASGIRPHYQAEDLQGNHTPYQYEHLIINTEPHPINTSYKYDLRHREKSMCISQLERS